MKVLVQSAKIFNSKSDFHLQTKDLLIENGTIVEIGDQLNDEEAQVISGKNLKVTAGWFDLYSVVREPGNENKDRLGTLVESALLGGFTDLTGVSGSNPSFYSRAQIEFVKNNTPGDLVKIHPLGTITEKNKGENITELYDLHVAGCLGFSDGKNNINNPELLKRALLYVKPFNGKVMVYSEDRNLAGEGMVNEGKVASTLGMKVRPSLAEEITVERNIQIATYAEAPIHIQAISSAKSIEIIRKAKSEGVQVTCDVNVANLLYTDAQVEGFDSNYKVLPVLRAEEDRKALIQGLKDGTIDAISSGHTPQDEESKACEFDHAEFGMMTLETFGVSLLAALGKEIGEELLFSFLSEKSRTLLGVENYKVEEGAKATLTVVSEEDWTFEKSQIKSVSKNNPMIGESFNQKVVAVINNGKLHLN